MIKVSFKHAGPLLLKRARFIGTLFCPCDLELRSSHSLQTDAHVVTANPIGVVSYCCNQNERLTSNNGLGSQGPQEPGRGRGRQRPGVEVVAGGFGACQARRRGGCTLGRAGRSLPGCRPRSAAGSAAAARQRGWPELYSARSTVPLPLRVGHPRSGEAYRFRA